MNYETLALNVIKIMDVTLSAFQKDWRSLPIKDNGEELVLVPSEFCHPFYADDMHITKDRRVFLRKHVFKMFIEVNKILSNLGLELKVYDGWRSVELQESLYWIYMKEFTISKFNDLNTLFVSSILPKDIKRVFEILPHDRQKELHDINKVYVSWPSKSIDSPSPHATGGAIDIWPYKNGQPIDLGVEFDSMEEKAGAFYHLSSNRKVFLDDEIVCYYRNVILYVMESVGFSCYPYEIWHFNYGNQMHALLTGQVACYSYIEP